MERPDTILAYQDRVFRLAHLVAGDERRAARLVERAFRRLPAQADDPERVLAAALLPASGLGWPWRPAPGASAGGLAPAELRALRGLLAAAAPAARLQLGARVLLGLDLGPAPAPAPAAPWPRRAPDGLGLRALLARDLGAPPADADYAELREHALLRDGALRPARAAELRAALLADGPAGERARALRDAVVRADERAAAALAALFGGAAPPELTERLLRQAGPRRGWLSVGADARLQLALCAAVVLLVAAAFLLPGRRPAAETPALAAAPALPPAVLVERARDRFAAAPERGVLYERYLAEVGAETWRVERWYDYAPPHPLRVEVRDATDRTLFALATDGRELVQGQFRGGRDEGQLRSREVAMTPAEIEALLPILRAQPDGLQRFGRREIPNLERFYLDQASSAPLADLGAATVAGRAARLVSFRSTAPLPPAGASPASAQVVLAIDAETYGLLEARVLPDGADAVGVVRTPWRAEAHDVLAAAPAGTFRLP